MIRITLDAANQNEGLLYFYLYEVTPPRPEAATAMLKELSEARLRILADPATGRQYPATYRELQTYEFLWLRVRAYWVSWATSPRGPIITNVFHAAADIKRRASPDKSNVQDW